MERKQVRLGVVGAGVIGGTIADFVSKHPQGKVTMVCDIDLARAKAIAEKYGAKATTSFEELVASSDVDLVHIGVPPLTHCPMVLAAFGTVSSPLPIISSTQYTCNRGAIPYLR